MSWQDVLKEKKIGPKPVEKPVMGTWDKSGKRAKFHRDRKRKLERQKESAKTKDANLFDFGKQEVKNFPVKRGTPTFEIWQAASNDDTWAEYTKDGLTSSQVQSVQKAKRLLQGEVVNIRGTDFKLQEVKPDEVVDNVDEVIARLNDIKPKKTSEGNIRGNLDADVKSFIKKKKYEELLRVLQGRGKKKYANTVDRTNSRVRRFIQTNRTLRRVILSDAEDKYPELVEIKKILKIGGVPQVDIGTSISDDIAIDYIKKIMNVSSVRDKKRDFITDSKDSGTLLLFGTRVMSPALEFVLENEELNQSAVPTSYKKRSNVEERALRKIIDEIIDEPSISVIYDKYKEDIENWFGPKGESDAEKEQRIKLREDNRNKYDSLSRKGNDAKRRMFADIKADEDANAAFKEVMAEVSGDTTNAMTEEIRDELVEALEDDSAKNFTAAIKKLGINDKFENMDAIEEEVGDIDDVIGALENMRLNRKTNKMQSLDVDKPKLRYFVEEKVSDAWSILEDTISDNLTPSKNPANDGTLDKIIITIKRLSEYFRSDSYDAIYDKYETDGIDERDLKDGDISSEDFKNLVVELYPKVRRTFLDNVKNRMKDISAEGKVMGTKIPSPDGGFVEPAIWIQISQGVGQ